MKKTILFLALAAIVASCDPKDDPKKFEVDVYATIDIKEYNASASVQKRVAATEGHLSGLEIVKRTTVIHFIMKDGASATRTFEPLQRDTVSETPMLKMWGTDIITETGSLEPGFIEGKDIVLEEWIGWDKGLPFSQCKIDTIAYIPNSVLRTAETAIKAAYAANNAEACYALFNDAFTFRPITGVEYRALKLAGNN